MSGEKTQEIDFSAELSKQMAEQLPEMVEELVAKHTSKLEAAEKAFRLTESEENKAKLKNVTKYSETVKFLNGLKQGDINAVREVHTNRAKALNEGTDSAGGFLVPEEFERSIMMYTNEYSEIRRNATVRETNAPTVKWNELVSKPTVYRVGELETITSSQPVFAETETTLFKLAGITAMSEEVYEDSEINLIDLLARLFAEQIAIKEQGYYVEGVSPAGLLTVAGTTVVDMLNSATRFDQITWDDLAAMQVALFPISKNEVRTAKYFMSMSVYNELRTAKGNDDHYILMPPVPTSDNPARTAWGNEIVVLTEYPETNETATNTKFVTYTDLRNHMAIVDKRGLRITTHQEGSVDSINLIQNDARAIRVVKRTSFTTFMEDGIVNLATN